jgi:hypothetical protein
MSQLSRDLKNRPTSPEIEQAIANVNGVVVELEGGNKDVSIISPTTTKLADLVYRKVAEVIGMIVMADPNALRGRPRNRRPSLAAIAKHGVEVKVEPDGSFVIAPGKPEAKNAVEENEWDQEYGPH